MSNGGYIGGPSTDHDDLNLVFEFDKFVDDIIKRENKKKVVVEEENNPNREYYKRYRDKWQNRTRLTVKK